MAGKTSDVDLGPMRLHLGEPADLPDSCLKPARTGDVEKLNALMRDGGRHHAVSAEAEERLSLSDINLQYFSQAMQEASTLNALSDSMASEVSKIRHVEKGQAVPEIEICIRESLLPDTTLTARDTDGCLSFELCVGNPEKRHWLAEKLPVLVKDLGQRLNRPLQVALFDPMHKHDALALCAWPIEGTA